MRVLEPSLFVATVFCIMSACGKSTPPPPPTTPAPPPATPAPTASAADVAPLEPTTDAAPAKEADQDEPELAPEAWTLSPPAAVPAITKLGGVCVSDLDPDNYHDLVPIALEGRVLELCRGSEIDEGAFDCWRLDLDEATLAKRPPSSLAKARMSPGDVDRPPSFPPELKIDAATRTAKSCVGECVPLDLGDMRPAAASIAAGRVLVAGESAMMEAQAAPKTAARVYDAKTGAVLLSLSYEDLGSDCPVFHWAGEVLYGELGVCAGPGAEGVFWDAMSGKRLGVLGGGSESAAAYAVEPVALPSGAVAFREQYGRAIFFHDGKTGAIVKRINLSKALKKEEDAAPDDPPFGHPEGGWMRLAETSGGKPELVVGHGGLDRDRILLVDPATPSITRVLEIAHCPE